MGHGLDWNSEAFFGGWFFNVPTNDIIFLLFWTLTIKVVFFFSSLIHSTSTHFCCDNFFRFSPYPFLQFHLSPVLSSLIRFFQNVICLPNLPLLLYTRPSLVQAMGRQLRSVASNANLLLRNSSTRMVEQVEWVLPHYVERADDAFGTLQRTKHHLLAQHISGDLIGNCTALMV